jgi:hypothetical protein
MRVQESGFDAFSSITRVPVIQIKHVRDRLKGIRYR